MPEQQRTSSKKAETQIAERAGDGDKLLEHIWREETTKKDENIQIKDL